ncbi:hypothetical protein VNO77_14547 [Canavalia gladiata]|uniref:Uncharacterized protein n=1 Tax=Canavalia gladiata TaxID=3824 RepID=A0AAN9QS13_CANGL
MHVISSSHVKLQKYPPNSSERDLSRPDNSHAISIGISFVQIQTSFVWIISVLDPRSEHKKEGYHETIWYTSGPLYSITFISRPSVTDASRAIFSPTSQQRFIIWMRNRDPDISTMRRRACICPTKLHRTLANHGVQFFTRLTKRLPILEGL